MTSMMQTLGYFPGQKATIFLQTTDGYGVPVDGNTTPTIQRIIFPDLSLAAGFPQNMVKLDVGLYYFQFTLPINATAIGSYLVDVSFDEPPLHAAQRRLYHIIVTAPYGLYSVGTN